MPRPRTFPDLHDADWLRARYVGEGLSQTEIAALIGCSTGAIGRALKKFDITARDRNEPEPVRVFAPLASRLELADLDADVAADELERRMREGLTDLAELVRLAAELPRERFYALVVEGVDAPTARACAFTAAVLAAEQTRRVPEAV